MSKRMPVEQFIPQYLAAVDAGMMREDLAKKLGISTNTLYQRIHDLNNECGTDFPQLPLRGRKSLKDRVQEAVASYKKNPVLVSTEDLDAILKG